MSEQLEQGRRLARRRWAHASFVMILIISGTIFGGLLFRSDALAFGQAIEAAENIISSVLWVFTTIIFLYLGVSVTEKIFARPKPQQEQDYGP